MTDKPILVSQPISLGDYIFCQTLVRKYANGRKIFWPIESYYVEGMVQAYPEIIWINRDIIRPELLDIKEKCEVDGFEIMPLRWSDVIMHVPYKDVMKSKYTMYDMDWHDWRGNEAYPEVGAKCFDLLKELSIEEGEQYNLINRNFLRGGQMKAEIEVNNGLRNIEMSIMDGYSLFDWLEVILNATTIHTVSTSILYLLELYGLNATEIHLYSRKPFEPGFSLVDYLFTRNYILHD